ncbi:hypothetical protein C5167_036512 [Papaver somniferum]|uniref:Uncharacterized protein n=1 Tax=Papaver somniferum TaxID=3469 RepID=A0A4Y7I813_PAPSO|nr:hypothetical protein C5167_036512 [Papaver somniferum]
MAGHSETHVESISRSQSITTQHHGSCKLGGGLWWGNCIQERIEKRRPFQYIVECGHWRDLILCVQEGVLTPRRETEKIVELVQEVAKDKESLENAEGKLSGMDDPRLEVGKHDPTFVLDGGENGMDDILHLCEGAASMLKPGGMYKMVLNEKLEDKCHYVSAR